MKLVSLTRGQVALVDDADMELVGCHSWHATPAHNSTTLFYARSSKVGLLHRFILSPPAHLEVDHIDRNPLNNSRTNLRVATRSQNCANGDMHRCGTTHFRGAYFVAEQNRFRSRISIEGKLINLGTFGSEYDAACAYDYAAIKYFGKFAQLNFPESDSDAPTQTGQAA